MKINHNMSAVVANNQLLRNEDGLSRSIERLSSGLRINRAADDAAGMAIATKMKAQIKGLDQASRNASDGVSVLDTADGALGEVEDMLQRMRELSVQAANDTNTVEDLKAIQAEIKSLTEEIDRVSRDTEFNTKALLDGTLDQRVYVDNRSVGRVQISDTVPVNAYEIQVFQDARQAVVVGSGAVGTGTVPAGTVVINGAEVKISEGEDLNDVYEKLRNAAEYGDVNLVSVINTTPVFDGTNAESAGYTPRAFAAGSTSLVFVSNSYGSAAELNIKCDNPALSSFLGIQENITVTGEDAQVDLEIPGLSSDFSPTASVSVDGTYVRITDINGFELSFELQPGIAETEYTDYSATANTTLPVTPAPGGTTPQVVTFDVTDIGALTLQIGANKDQTVNVRIPNISSESLYIDKVDVSVLSGADKAIVTYDKAISYVSKARSRIGAYQNRLDYSVSNLDTTSLNITSALSRIEDVDMAKEMSEYTKYNVLTQAANSVLAQANDLPQQTLQLLQ